MQTPAPLRRRVAPQALPISLGLLAASGLAFALGAWLELAGGGSAGLGLLLLAAANLAFFRNPRREAPPGERLVVAPADGRVVEVAEVEDPDGYVSPARRIAIFLSILDVHVNRAPLTAKVRALRRRGSGFLAAFNPSASERNVQLRLDLETPGGTRIGLVQITGLIARRIFCYAAVGAELERGMSYGLICYGSRVELYLPASAEIRVGVGDHVRAGSSVLAEVPE